MEDNVPLEELIELRLNELRLLSINHFNEGYVKTTLSERKLTFQQIADLVTNKRKSTSSNITITKRRNFSEGSTQILREWLYSNIVRNTSSTQLIRVVSSIPQRGSKVRFMQ